MQFYWESDILLHIKRVIVLSAVLLGLAAPAWSDAGNTPSSEAPAVNPAYSVQLVINDRILDVRGQIIDGYTFIPLRAAAEAMGGQITSDVRARHITMSLRNVTADFTLDRREVTVNERHILMGTAPRRIRGVTCVPLRFFVDSCGARLDWSNYPKIAYLYSQDYNYNRHEAGAGAIKAVFVSPHRPLATGDILNIEILALPASRVTVDIEGVQNGVPTYEDRPGCYKAQLTVSDSMKAFESSVTANLVQNGQTSALTSRTKVTVNALQQSASGSALHYSPAGNSLVVSRRPNITVSYDDYSLQRDSIRLWFDEQEYTHQIAFRTNCAIWRPAADLSYGKHHVRFSAKDSGSAPISCDWYFAVVPDKEVISDSDALPVTKLRVSSPRNGDGVNDIFTVFGRATAGSDVTITVTEREGRERGVVSSPGITITKTVQADLTGRFQAEFDVSAVRAGHRLSVVTEAEKNTVISHPHRLEVIRR